MSWVDAISSALNVSAGGTAIAAGTYAGAVALEREMREEAKREISGFLKRTNLHPDMRTVLNLIKSVFDATFGSRHFSIKCIFRSIIATYLFFVAICLLLYLKYPEKIVEAFKISFTSTGTDSWVGYVSLFILGIGMVCCIPDYISLYKGRVLLNVAAKRPIATRVLACFLTDILGSILLSFGSLSLLHFMFVPDTTPILDSLTDGIRSLSGKGGDRITHVIVLAMTLTTLMTSLWSSLIAISAIGVKISMGGGYVMRLVTWVFDVDAHPIRVLGLVGGVMIWGGSFLYGLA